MYKSKFNVMGGFLRRDKYSLSDKYSLASQVCMMAEIRRGEEYQVAL